MSNHIELDSLYRDRQAFTNPCDYDVTTEQLSTWMKWARDVRALPQNPGERPLDFVSSMNLISAILPYPRIELFATRLIILDSITGGNTWNTIDPHGLSINDIVMTSSPGYSVSNGIQRNVEYHVIATPTATSFQVSLTQGGAAAAFTNGTGLDLTLAVITPAEYVDVIDLNDAAANLPKFPRVYVDIHSEGYQDLRRVNSINSVLADAKFVLIQDKIQFDQDLMPVWIHYRSHSEQVMRFKRDHPIHVRFMTRDGTTIPFFIESDLSIQANPYKQSILTLVETPYIRDALYANHASDPIS